ncbi:MAG: hypothetical protein LBS67_05550 [Clostridiales Family XIII bacterium]|jgi:hypothetical protein|nr:hypothetical protein [Clostridiales Family XIII bacterium]
MYRGLSRVWWIVVVALTVCAALFALGVIAAPSRVVWDNGHGDIYRGDILRGQWIGEVRIDYSDGSVYEGRLKDGRWQGHGVYRTANGLVYKGEFKEGHPTESYQSQ